MKEKAINLLWWLRGYLERDEKDNKCNHDIALDAIDDAIKTLKIEEKNERQSP